MTRIAIINKEKCKPNKCGNLCAKVCPVNKTGKMCITFPEVKAEIDEILCTGCGICVKRCPFDAITIINLPEQLTHDPIHRYGKNGFCLYSLPSPIPGKVVGIVGRNGIGKTTAFKILAGVLNPNFGEVDSIHAGSSSEKVDYDRLISYFKGTESQGFFEQIRDQKLIISYKPQAVDMIPKQFNGTVRDLLEKVDADEDRFKKITEQLEIASVLDRDISSVSGGELQRIAIAATMLKKADLYIFDEPTSYLDINQRLRVSKIIRSLVEDGTTSVLLIEHDLIILDYIADMIHLMYGREGVYGVVSQPKSTKAGINVFLSGMLREENVRFRDYSIVFSQRPALLDPVEGGTLIEWETLQKRFDGFTLDIEPATIRSKNIIGILGANGIGKTTFARLLAGVTKPDSGTLEKSVKISYKPQYINTTSEQQVYEVVSKAVEHYENVLIKPLGIQHLFEKKLSQLSGGELQRVSIVAALTQEADLFILDEPSAYLDVEQRILLSKIIAEFIEHNEKTAIVIDHDLLFIDYLSQKIMVFNGQPSQHGHMQGVFPMEEGMNHFLEDLNITFRRDPESFRPRANKPQSQLDRQQKAEKQYYYM